MKIAFSSDLHVNSSDENHDIVQAIRKRLKDTAPDVFIIAGDISSSLFDIDNTLAAFAELPMVKMFVPGNHDVWIEDKITSNNKYHQRLPKICRERGFHPLWMEPYIIGDTGFCGSMAWYDLTLRSTLVNFTDADYAKKRHFLFTWMDKYRMKFIRDGEKLDDNQLTEYLLGRFNNDLQTVSEQVSRIVAVFHHVPFREAIDYYGKANWDYFSAFLGSSRFGDLILANPKIREVICGHYHRKKTVPIPSGPTVRISPFGYYAHEGDKPFRKWVANRLSIIDI